MAPPVGVKLSQFERSHRMRKRMEFAFRKHFPRCEVVVLEIGGHSYLQIDKVVRFVLCDAMTTKISWLDDANAPTFMFTNHPRDTDLDRRMKSHSRMWQLFMASEVGQEKIKKWNELPTQTRVRLLPYQIPTGFTAIDKTFEGGIKEGEFVMFAAVPSKPRAAYRSFNCLIHSKNNVAGRVIQVMARNRKLNNENVVLFSSRPLSEHGTLPNSVDISFQLVKCPVTMIAAIEKVRAEEGYGQRLHLIIDSSLYVEPAEPNVATAGSSFHLPYRFKNDALKKIAETVEVLTVVVGEPNAN